MTELLLAREIEAIIAPHSPAAFEDRSGQIVRLFSDTQAVEEDYYRRTGIYPIMHVLVLRADVHREYPWVAANLLKAFTAAKDRSLARAVDTNVPRSPIPWAAARATAAHGLFGEDLWPYGVDANRTTLKAFLGNMHEQGLTPRRLEPEELFAPQTLTSFRV